MYRVKLRIEGVPSAVGMQAALDITEAFKQRTWHDAAVCSYEQGGLTLTSENDFDFNGLATQDELSDEFSANVNVTWEDNGNLSVVSVEEF
jgi:hypothetical protein